MAFSECEGCGKLIDTNNTFSVVSGKSGYWHRDCARTYAMAFGDFNPYMHVRTVVVPAGEAMRPEQV